MKSVTATPICKICFSPIRQINWLRFFHGKAMLCDACLRKMNPVVRKWRCDGVVGYSFYVYNDFLKSILFQYKGCFDIELSDVFLGYQSYWLHEFFRHHTLVPAPSFLSKDEARGFNHVEEMYRCLRLPTLKAIIKTKDIKQALRSRSERERISDCLSWDSAVSVKNKKILFVDDLFTTGATAKACCRLLKDHGAKSVKILAMALTMKKEVPANGEDEKNSARYP